MSKFTDCSWYIWATSFDTSLKTPKSNYNWPQKQRVISVFISKLWTGQVFTRRKQVLCSVMTNCTHILRAGKRHFYFLVSHCSKGSCWNMTLFVTEHKLYTLGTFSTKHPDRGWMQTKFDGIPCHNKNICSVKPGFRQCVYKHWFTLKLIYSWSITRRTCPTRAR